MLTGEEIGVEIGGEESRAGEESWTGEESRAGESERGEEFHGVESLKEAVILE